MNNYIKDWFYVIKNCSVDNTYKMGWSKSIIECCIEAQISFKCSSINFGFAFGRQMTARRFLMPL